mmetsp:Transcript_4943/g.6972  ORF Transcript_4943/g.6972 Transcript_4943/m.6972 type:complete len:1087 (-) Transcript_4943:79-3339(-)
MVNYKFAVTVLLLALPSGSYCFSPFVASSSLSSRGATATADLVNSQSRNNHNRGGIRRDASTTLYDNAYPGDDEETQKQQLSSSLGAAISNVNATISQMVADEEDIYEAEAELKKRIVQERSGNYEVVIPLQATETEGLTLGFSLCEVDQRVFSDVDLNFDTLRLEAPPAEVTGDVDDGSIQTMDQSKMARLLPPDVKGVVVSSIVKGGWAWNQGIRPGDLLKATSATLGDALWPKSTIEGVRSAISSRKLVSPTMAIQFQRINAVEGVGEQFELTLTRPIGLEIEETGDGYVQVAGFTKDAPKLVKYAVQVGDRILGIGSMSGKNVWPVSTVDGIRSACSSRLPGQKITFRFARPLTNKKDTTTTTSAVSIDPMDTNGSNGATTILDRPGATTATTMTTAAASATTARTATATATKKNALSNEELLSRCRDVLGRYMSKTTEENKYGVPAIVADRVVEALASASATLDARTLSAIMNAYLKCRQPQGAIRIFEAAVGFKADGSSASASIIQGKEKTGQIMMNESALNLYTATSLLRAHALQGDIRSVRRVLAALEGRDGVDVHGVAAAAWPGTGLYGSIVPDTKCYNIAMSAGAKAGGSEGCAMAVELFERMNGKLARDVVSYNTVIGALAKEGRFDDAFEIFESMKQQNVQPDKITYTSLIKACVHDGDIEELLLDMKERKVKADVVTYNTMVKVLCDRNRWYDAKNLITDMEASGIMPNSMTYGLLMDALLKANKPAACLTLFESASSDSRTAALTENVYLYTTAIAATSALSNHEKALDLISRMKAAGVKPNLETLTAVMGACLSSGMADMAADVFRKIDEPDGFAISMGLRALCDANDLVAASALLSKHRDGYGLMSGKEVMKSYNTLLRSTLEQENYALAGRTFTELLGTGYIPNKNMYRTIIDALNLGVNKKRLLPVLEPIADETFQFLLFVLDSVEQRNLSLDGAFYASVLFCGSRMGGVQRKIASFLAEARSAAGQDGTKSRSIIAVEGTSDQSTISWEDFLLNYDEHKNDIGSQLMLPGISVQTNNKNIRQVLSAERAVTYKSAKKSVSQPRRLTTPTPTLVGATSADTSTVLTKP